MKNDLTQFQKTISRMKLQQEHISKGAAYKKMCDDLWPHLTDQGKDIALDIRRQASDDFKASLESGEA